MQNILTETSAEKHSKIVKQSEMSLAVSTYNRLQSIARNKPLRCDTSSKNATTLTEFRFRWLNTSNGPVSIPATGTFRERPLALDAINVKYGLMAPGLCVPSTYFVHETSAEKEINPKRS